MSLAKTTVSMWNLTVKNIGGIRAGSTSIAGGLNVIQASNFRGKSSLVTAIMTALGATGHYDDHPLTEGTAEGEVTLAADEGKYNVKLKRGSLNAVDRTGEPYISDETEQVAARLFACLDEDNPVRMAVRNGEDLTDLLQAPLEIEDLEAQIETLKIEKREIETEITEAERAGEQLTSVQEEVTHLERELEELYERRQGLADEGDSKDQIENLSDEISNKSGKLANLGDDITRIEQEIERKQDSLSQKEAEQDQLEVPDEVDDTQDLDVLRDRIDNINRQIDLVEDLYRANQNVVDAGELDIITEIDRSITADEVECWVCGQQTTKSDIENYISRLQSEISELREQKGDIQAELEEARSRRREVRQARSKKEQLQRDIQQLKASIDERRGTLEKKRDRKEELETEIEALREKLADAEDEFNEELTDVKTTIRTKETKLESKRQKLESLEQQHEALGELEQEYQEVQSELENLRNRKKTTQESLQEQFNTVIADIIEVLQPGFSSARLVLKTDEQGAVDKIDLEIARDIDSKGKRTSVDTLSEGEVELIGLVVALAGYHAFNVRSTAPCILIDGISQLATEHLRRVTSYIDDMSAILVTTAYPEAGEFEGHIIDPEEWDVVSDEPITTT
jgi:predicted  nucleic acid-binding Zn-ribbon protein